LKLKARLWIFTAILSTLATAGLFAAGDITGTVKDKSGGALVGADVNILSPQLAAVASTKTDKDGKFRVTGLADGQYLLIVKFPGLAERHVAATVGASAPALEIVLDVAAIGEDVTVTANPGGLGDINRLTQPVNVISADDVLIRAGTIVAQVVEGETGVNLQRTSPGMAGIFVRGLTGNKVNVFVDGVRYSNGAQRGGVNTFLDLIDPSTLEGVEVLRGTASAQYGSDALGGSVQFLSRVPTFSVSGEPKWSGNAIAGGEAGGHPGGFGTFSFGFGAKRFAMLGSASYRKTGDYRPGGTDDSHASVTRFFGLPSGDFYGDRMFETGFEQKAQQFRMSGMAKDNLLMTFNYVRSRQDQANRWDQTLGGDGNLIAELNDLQLDLAYLRVEKLKAGWFDNASFTYSFSTQREERVNQGGNGNPTASIAHEPERTNVHGVQMNLTKQVSAKQSWLFGGDAYFESSHSLSFDVNPTTLVQTVRRPRVPDQATYLQSGVFAQLNLQATDRLSVIAAIRAGFNSYESKEVFAPVISNRPLWPDDSLDDGSATFRLGAAFQATKYLALTAAISTGYRSPHMTDLGTLGLTGSGFEVAAPDIAGQDGFVGSTADATAVSTGKRVEQLGAETNVNYDFGARYKTDRVSAQFNAFVNNIDGNIQKQTLILPQGAVGTFLGTEPITSQNANGAVFVALSANPVLVRANFDEARIWGIEWTGDFKVAKDMTLGSTYTYIRARDLSTDLSPNIEGGTPAPFGTVWFRYAKSGQKWWAEPYVMFSQEQTHLSSLDLSDRRTGATRTRGQIQNFFRQGARVRGWINAGPDGTFGNGDDFLIATNETLAQIQDRVLGVGVSSKPLWTAVPAYGIVGVRVGLRFGPHSIVFDASNLGDQNYRGISWGMDGPGRMLTVRYHVAF
jgi:hemoglobin/transferrin/lactoferrin receptor protein